MNTPGESLNRPNTAPVSTTAIARQKGVGLIEVMVGVLIFVGGVMAVAGMHSHALRSTHDSIQRSQALWLANAAAELMRLNPAGLASSAYQSSAANASSNLVNFCASLPVQCIGNSCTPNQMALFDVHDLMCKSTTEVINPTMSINCPAPCNSGSSVQIAIAWDSRGAEQGVLATRQQVEFSFKRN